MLDATVFVSLFVLVLFVLARFATVTKTDKDEPRTSRLWISLNTFLPNLRPRAREDEVVDNPPGQRSIYDRASPGGCSATMD